MYTRLNGCVNCKVCEMMCSFHHSKSFGYSGSSIEIGEIPDGFGIRFPGLSSGRPGCDRCKGEAVPLCLRYCPKTKGYAALSAFLGLEQ